MRITALLVAGALPMLAACGGNTDSGDQQQQQSAETNSTANIPQQPSQVDRAQQGNQPGAPIPPELQNLRFLVDISDRELRLLNGDRLVGRHPVAVGTEKWPTPTGSWQIHQVDLNPEWNPPKSEEWAEEREAKAPGAPDNPMGRARLVYRMPNTIHGTDNLDSLGKAASHGSIRVANDVVVELAGLLLKAGGAWQGDQWFQQMTQNRTTEHQIELPDPVPIVVQD